MSHKNKYDVIIIGGSYAGLQAAMTLGRSLRKVLVIDSGLPCNRQTPHSHNFITQDGVPPAIIAQTAKAEVEKYSDVTFLKGKAISGKRVAENFEITTEENQIFYARKIIFAAGVKDIFPAISGIAECWGISVIHCPYCHGYEVRGKKTGIIADGEFAMHFAQLIKNLTSGLFLLTNGQTNFSDEQWALLKANKVKVIEKEIDCVTHQNGQIEKINFRDGSSETLDALYLKPDFVQHCEIPAQLGCELTQHGHLKVDGMYKTNVPGTYACGDCVSPMRSVASAVAAGNMAGAVANSELAQEDFAQPGDV